MCSSSPSSFFFSLISILRLGLLLRFVLLEKKSSFFFLPFWPLLLEQFRVLVFFLGNRPAPREQTKSNKAGLFFGELRDVARFVKSITTLWIVVHLRQPKIAGFDGHRRCQLMCDASLQAK